MTKSKDRFTLWCLAAQGEPTLFFSLFSPFVRVVFVYPGLPFTFLSFIIAKIIFAYFFAIISFSIRRVKS
jgi:hypothetical protein